MEFQKEDYIKYRAAKSKSTLLEVKLLLENQFWNTAISRMYYACFYMVGALLVKNNIKAQSHSGCIQQFGKHFVLNEMIDKQSARVYFELFEKGKRVIIMIFLILIWKLQRIYIYPQQALLKKSNFY